MMTRLYRRSVWIVLLLLMTGITSVQAQEDAGLATPLQSTDGKVIRLTDYQGKVVLINFWATWCPPCLEEIPALIQLQKSYAERGLVVIGIDYMEKPDKERLNAFIEEHGINYPIVYGEVKSLQGVTRSLGGVFALPVTKILDRTGKLAGGHIGGLNLEEMKKLVEPLL